MCKGTEGGIVDVRLQADRRSRGFPSWFTVAMAPKGSDRGHDVLDFLNTLRALDRRSILAHTSGGRLRSAQDRERSPIGLVTGIHSSDPWRRSDPRESNA